MYSRIVVPLDGSELALTALPQARDLARLYSAELVIVRVTQMPLAITSPLSVRGGGINPPFGVVAEDGSDTTNSDRAYVDGVVRGLTAEGFAADGVVLPGAPASAITSVLSPGDMLVMTSHGHTGLRRLFMGSVAADVLKRATVPVLIMRPAETQPEG
jgi:nucleotide-binding universal stress UspA family protein